MSLRAGIYSCIDQTEVVFEKNMLCHNNGCQVKQKKDCGIVYSLPCCPYDRKHLQQDAILVPPCPYERRHVQQEAILVPPCPYDRKHLQQEAILVPPCPYDRKLLQQEAILVPHCPFYLIEAGNVCTDTKSGVKV